MSTSPRYQYYVRPLSESIAYQMGLQISCGVCTETKKESIIWEYQKSIRPHIPCACKTEGVWDHRRSCNARPRPYVNLHTSKVCRILNHRISEGQERHYYCKAILGQAEKLYGRTFLGKGLMQYPRLDSMSSISRSISGIRKETISSLKDHFNH